MHIYLEIWLRLGQTNNKPSTTWRQEEKEFNQSRRQTETGQDTTWRQRKMVRKMSPQRGDKGERKRNAQVVRGHSPRIRNGRKLHT